LWHRAGMSGARDERRDRGVALAAAAVVLLGAAAYANSLHGPFVFDDDGANESIRRLASLGDVLFGARHATVIGRPVLNLSFTLNYAACGLDVALWHA